jgi:hypothetical protein
VTGSAVLNFGARGGYAETSVSAPSILANSILVVRIGGSTPEHSEDEHAIENLDVGIRIAAGVGFTAIASVRKGLSHGTFNFYWSIQP